MAEPNQQLAPIQAKLSTVRDLLYGEQMQKQLKMALPKHVNPEKLARLAMTALRSTPKLLDCDQQSLLGAIMEAGQLGLEIGSMGQAWLIPYGKEATLIVGYRGMLDLAWRSDKIRAVSAKCVYEGDKFDLMFGLHPVLDHLPVPESEQGSLTHAYAIIETANGGVMFEVMTLGELEEIRLNSRGGKSGPWITNHSEMCKKTVLRRLLKLAPCSTELQRAVTLDEQAELGIPQELGDTLEVPYSETQSDEPEESEEK